MIPELVDSGLWLVLPEGIHEATIEEIEERFALGDLRKLLLIGIKSALRILKDCDCKRAYLGGSYVTNKITPNDFDMCYDKEGMNLDRLYDRYPVFRANKITQKKMYSGEFYRSTSIAEEINGKKINYLNFFQRDKYTGLPKGIITINLNVYDKELKRIKIL